MLLQLAIVSCILAQSSDFCNFYIRSSFDSECIITSYKPGDPPDPQYDEHQCLAACRGSQVTYSIIGLASGLTYSWAVSGSDSYTTNSNNNTITVNWSEHSGIGAIILYVYGEDDELLCEKQLCIDLIERPIAGIASNPTETGYTPSGIQYIDVCDGQEIQFYDNSTSSSDSPIVGYYWSVGSERASSQNYTFIADYNTYGSSATIVHKVVNECGCEDSTMYVVNISRYPTLRVDCFGTACENTSATYNAINICNNYFWHVEGGHIQDGQGTNSLTVMWDDIDNGYGYIALNGPACEQQACPYLTYLPIPVISDNAEIQGPDIVCVDDIVYFELPQWASTAYTWSITPTSGVEQLFSGHPHKFLLNFQSQGTYTINCNYNCAFLECGGAAQTKTIIVKKPFVIVSPNEACENNSVTFTTDNTNEIYSWTIYSNGTAIYTQTASSISYTFSNAGTYTVEASNQNFCNHSAYSSIKINESPSTPDPDVSDWINRVCIGNGYTFNAIPDLPQYYLHWSASCGQPSQFDGNEYNVVLQSPLCSINLQQIDRRTNCPSPVYNYPLTQFVPQTITWPTYNECANEEFTMSVTPEDGVLLEWSLVPTNKASIVSDRFANTVTIQTNGTSGTFQVVLKRTFCSSHIYDTVPVTIKPYIVPEISMQKNICQYSTIAISAGNTEQIQGTWTLEIEGHTYTYTGLPSGATWNYTFNNSGTIPVSLSFSADGCTHTYETIETVNVIAAPQFSLSYHEITQDTLYELNATILEPNAVGYSYSWSNGLQVQQFQHNGPTFSYSCTVVDNTTGCTNSKTVSRPQPIGCIIREGDVYMSGSCASRTFVNNSSGNIFWTFDQNASSPQFTTSGANNNTCDATFTDAGYYRVSSYYMDNNCAHYRDLEFCIPLIARMNINYLCASGTDICLVLENTSDFMVGTTINSETWYIDGLPVSNPNYCVVSSGTHTITLTVNYSGSVGSGSCTTSQTVTYNRGSAAFMVSSGPYCSETGIQFTDNSTNAVSWCWTFASLDISTVTNYSQNPEQSLINNLTSPKLYTITLIIEDNIGCTSSASIPLMINPNTLRGSIYADLVAVCYGNPRTIEYHYLTETPPSTSPVYHWYETNQTTTVDHNDFYETGSYYVQITDNNGCATQSDWANICFKSVPIAEISGEANYCPDGVINLIGDSGNNTYEWTGLDPLTITTPNLSYDIASNGLSVGNYTVTLTVSNDGCYSTASKSISVHSAPTAPTIGFGANRCLHTPPVNLISTASQNLHWSTGTFGLATETFNAGIHTAYYTDLTTGCRSENTEIDVPKPPDFNELMTGCFEFCEQDLPRTVLGPLGSYDAWKWNLDNIIIQGGTGYISNLNVPSFGTYFLDVSYPTVCQSTSDNLVVSQKKECDSCNIIISLLKEPECDVINCELRVRFVLSIYNAGTNAATLYNVYSPMINTLYYPSLSQTINPGTSSSYLFEIGLSSYEPSDMYFEFFFDENGRPCISHFNVDLSDILSNCITEECNITFGYFDYNDALSPNGISYFDYYFSTSTGMSNVQLYSDDVTIVDFNYNPSTGNISGLFFITRVQLIQLLNSNGHVCFRLYGCYSNKICSVEICVPANALALKGKLIVIDENSTETESIPDTGESISEDFCLYPNPATSSVSISGDNFSKATIIDTSGRIVMEVYDATFDIGTLSNGEYIVKIISLDGNIQYLKLVKQ